MRALALVVLLLLSGCAQRERDPVLVDVDITEGERPARPPCGEWGCSFEWWNVTIEAQGVFSIETPVPVVVAPYEAETGPRLVPRLAGGTGNATLTERGALLRGEGPATFAAYRTGEPEDGETPERFLRARWGPAAEDLRPTRLDVDLTGNVSRIELTYEARSDVCERRARFSSEGDPAATLRGEDRAWCA